MAGIGKAFVEKTKTSLAPSDQMRGVPQPPLVLSCDPSLPRVTLPDPDAVECGSTVKSTIRDRRSVREYSAEPLGSLDLSYLLWSTQGIRSTVAPAATFRTVPSAGARHAFETFLSVNKITDIEPGLYRYLATEHSLVRTSTQPKTRSLIVKACFDQGFLASSAVVFIWCAVVYRMTWRYGERGYRYLYLDAGHVCENLYLAAESIGCGACAVGAFSDDQLNRILRLDGETQFVIYLAAAGKKRPSDQAIS